MATGRSLTRRQTTVVAAVAAVACSAWRASVLAAQDTSATRASDARCDSIVASARVDTVSSGLFLSVKRVDGGELSTVQIADMLLMTGAAFVPPTPFRLTVFTGPALTPSFRRRSAKANPVLRSPTLTGGYRVKVGADGAFSRLETIRASLMPGFDSAALVAIKAAGDSKGLFVPLDGTGSATIDFRFATDSGGGPGWTAQRLVRTILPRMPVTDATVEPASASADLPQSERREGVPAETVLRFVVDRAGEPIMETLEIVRGTSLDFVRGALTALGKQHFAPARIKGCAVAQLVEFPFILPPLSPSGLPPGDVRF